MLKDDLMPVFPDDKIKCRNCAFKKPGIIGYKNAYCDKYPYGKPDNVLFKNADCKLFDREKAST